jgi:hypothetical protein
MAADVGGVCVVHGLARLRQGYGAKPSLFGLPAEALAKAGKMSTFVSGKKTIDSSCYGEFMSTFVYLVEKALFNEINELTSKNVYFYILLTTFHIGSRGVSFGINGLSATDA